MSANFHQIRCKGKGTEDNVSKINSFISHFLLGLLVYTGQIKCRRHLSGKSYYQTPEK